MTWKMLAPESLPSCWPDYAPLVRQALDAGEGSHDERDTLFALLSGQWQLWAYDKTAICITEVVQFPRQRKLLVRYIAGVWEPILKGLEHLEFYARQAGCSRIEAYMRKGLARRLDKHGWNVRHVFAVRELD